MLFRATAAPETLSDSEQMPLYQASQRLAGRLAFAAALVFWASIAATAQPNPSGVRLAGVIQDQTGAVVPDAKVEISAGTYKDARRSSEQGTFEFTAVPTAKALITVDAAGFAPYSRELEIGGDTRLSIELLPAVRRDEIVVTAGRVPESSEQIADQIVVQERSELASTAAPTLDDALRQVPGFTLFRRSGSRTANPTSQGVSLRGVGASGASRAVVVRDGVPLNDPFGAWVYWGRVPRESIEAVEVLSG
jgi:outer membrane receptor protein involved in Fe transport